MLVVRLRRIGKKGHPTYRIVVAEHTAPIQGKFVADLGFYNPHTKKQGVDQKGLLSWLNKGAKPSNTIAKIFEGMKIKHASIVVVKRHKASRAKEDKETKPPIAVTAQVDDKGEVTGEVTTEPEEVEAASAEASNTETEEKTEV